MYVPILPLSLSLVSQQLIQQSYGERTANCVDSYMNSSLLIVKYLESRRGGQM